MILSAPDVKEYLCPGKQIADVSCINFVEREGIRKLEEYRQRMYGNTKEKKKF